MREIPREKERTMKGSRHEPKRRNRFRDRVRSWTLGLTVLAAVGSTACDTLLDVDLPSQVEADDLNDPGVAEILVMGAVASFDCALANYIPAGGMMTDELIGSTGWIAPTEWHQRRIQEDSGQLVASCTALGWGVFSTLSTAYFQARDSYRKISDFSDEEVENRTELLATASAYSGYAATIIGESFCEATLEMSPIMTRTEVLETAEEQFTDAISLAEQAGNSEILNMARVGRARVRLNLGRRSDAVADAQEVPEGFVKYATRSGGTERRWNRIAVDQHENFFIAVDPRFRDLEVDGVPDPRVPIVDAGRVGHDGQTQSILSTKYVVNSDPIPIASWDEAQLIIAEGEGGEAAVEAINRLRAKEGLPGFDSSDEEEIAAQVLEERRRELFLEGQRLGDFLRLDELEFDQGTTPKGVPFGGTTCLPLPQSERNSNPNISS